MSLNTNSARLTSSKSTTKLGQEIQITLRHGCAAKAHLLY